MDKMLAEIAALEGALADAKAQIEKLNRDLMELQAALDEGDGRAKQVVP